MPNSHKIKQMTTKYTEWSQKISKFSIETASKMSQKFGLKIKHLATLLNILTSAHFCTLKRD
jgi:hypothetical protein